MFMAEPTNAQTAAEKARALLERMKAKKAVAQTLAPVVAQAEVPAPVVEAAQEAPEVQAEPAAPPVASPQKSPLTPPPAGVEPPPLTRESVEKDLKKIAQMTADEEIPDVGDEYDGPLTPGAKAARASAVAEDDPLEIFVNETPQSESPFGSSETSFADLGEDVGLPPVVASPAEAPESSEKPERPTGPIVVGTPDAVLSPESAASDAIAEAVIRVDDSRAFEFDAGALALLQPVDRANGTAQPVAVVEEGPEPELVHQPASNILLTLAKARAGNSLDEGEALEALRVLSVGRFTAQRIRNSPGAVDPSIGTNAAALLANDAQFLPNVRTILAQSPESVLRQIEADSAENWNPIRETVRVVAEERGINLSQSPGASVPSALLGEGIASEGAPVTRRSEMPKLVISSADVSADGSTQQGLLGGLPSPQPAPRSPLHATARPGVIPVLIPPRHGDGSVAPGAPERPILGDTVPGRGPAGTSTPRELPQPLAPQPARASFSPKPSASRSGGDDLSPFEQAEFERLDREREVANRASAAAQRVDREAIHPGNHDADRDRARAEALRSVAVTGGQGSVAPAPEEPEYIPPSISAYSVGSFLRAMRENPNPRGSNHVTRYEREVYGDFSKSPDAVVEIKKNANAAMQWQRIEEVVTIYWASVYQTQLLACTSISEVRDCEPASPNPAQVKAFVAARRDFFMQVVLEKSDQLDRAPYEKYVSMLDTIRTTWGQEVFDLLVTNTSELHGPKPAWLEGALERASEAVRGEIAPMLTPIDRTLVPWTVEMVFDRITSNPHAIGSAEFARYDSELYEQVTREASGIVPEIQRHRRGVLWGRIEVAHAEWMLQEGATTATVPPTSEMLAAGKAPDVNIPEDAIVRGRSRNIDGVWDIEGYREAVRSINRLPKDTFEEMFARAHVLLYDTIVAESPNTIGTLETHKDTRVFWKVTTSTYERDGPSVLADMIRELSSNEARVDFFVSRFTGTKVQKTAVNAAPPLFDSQDWYAEFSSYVEARLSSILNPTPPSRSVLVNGLLALFNGATPNDGTDDSRAVVNALNALERLGPAETKYYVENTPDITPTPGQKVAVALKEQLGACKDVKAQEGDTTWQKLLDKFKSSATAKGFSVSCADQGSLPAAPHRTDVSALREKLGLKAKM